MKYIFKKAKPSIDFIALWDNDAKEIFEGSANIKIMTVAEFAINLELINHFNLVDMYAESYINKTPISQNPVEVFFGLNYYSATKEKAIKFMCDYLGDFNRTDLKPETEIMLYVIKPTP